MTQALARILFWRAVRSAMPSPVALTVLPPETRATAKPVVLASSLATATRLRALADGLGLLIERKMQPAVANQNLTHRRAEMLRSMRADGERLEELQQVLRVLADLHENGNCPALVRRLTNKSAVEQVLHYSENYPSTGFAAKLGYTADTFQEAKQYLKSLTTEPSEEQQRDKRLRELEHKLIGCDIPGFFPTPNPVAKKMLELVAHYLSDCRSDCIRILEPSAGKGDLLDALRDEYPEECVSDWTVHCCEINFTLRSILSMKGYCICTGNFLDLPVAVAADQYDLILMNPPFENSQDAEHVRYCYERLLSPGGELVACMSTGPFHRSDAKSAEFREWCLARIDEGGAVHRLPDGSFTGKDAFRQTGVSTCLVHLKKPL